MSDLRQHKHESDSATPVIPARSVLPLVAATSLFVLGVLGLLGLLPFSPLSNDPGTAGSPGNPSDRRRAGLTIRYSPTNVKCDLSVNPHFRSYLARGVDEFGYNPAGELPKQQFGRLHREHRSIEEAGTEAESRVWKM